jgi:hypothetical protein
MSEETMRKKWEKIGTLLNKVDDKKVMENSQLIFRQGDVILKGRSLIEPHKELVMPEKIIAYGEITGHSHKFRDSDQVLVFRDPDKSTEPRMVKIEQQVAVLEHQEHLPLQIPEGVYERTIQSEYNPFLERSQMVYD